jgi:hypothetical protein
MTFLESGERLQWTKSKQHSVLRPRLLTQMQALVKRPARSFGCAGLHMIASPPALVTCVCCQLLAFQLMQLVHLTVKALNNIVTLVDGQNGL